MFGFYPRNRREEKENGKIRNEINRNSKSFSDIPLLKYGVRSYFERELFENALTVGLSVEDFWYSDPELYFSFLRVYEEKQKQISQYIWQIGVRVKQALGSTIIYPAGVVDKSTISSMEHYPQCPFTEKSVEEMTDEEVECERQKFIIQMENWVSSFKTK